MDAITVEYLEEQIADKIYVNPCGTLTICVLTMRNGLRITGESACLDVSRFDAELGKAIAYQNAFEKLWQLEGYCPQWAVATRLWTTTYTFSPA
jgi:hypothetical protein